MSRWRNPSLLWGFLAAYLLLFLVFPVGKLFFFALIDDAGSAFGGTFRLFLDNPLYLESLGNSLLTALGASLLAALTAIPLAMLLWRFRLHPPLVLELFCFLPLFIPAFMLSLSLQSLLGRGGALGLMLQSFADLDPSRWGLLGVMLIEAIHYFPLVLICLMLNTSAFSQQADEAVRLGNSWPRLLTRVFLPLGLPGLAFGMVITFLKTLDDLATPLSLGLTNLLAPQAFFRVSTYGAQDPLSSLTAVLMIVISALAWLLTVSFVQHGASRWGAVTAHGTAPLSRRQRRVAFACLGAMAAFYLLCYSGTILNSFARIWSHSLLPESWVWSHYLTALKNETGSFVNTLLYCGFAAVIDVIVGLAMAYAIGHASARWKKTLAWGAAGLLSVPGVALAIAYLQFFQGCSLPFFDKPLDAPWFLLPMVFAVRGLPFAIRVGSFALQNLSPSCLEIAALSGTSRFSILWRIAVPMMGSGLLMALLICFGIAAADLSSAMLLVPGEADAPVSYSIYLHMQAVTGRGAGSALALLTIAVVALGMTVFAFFVRRTRGLASGFWRIVFSDNLREGRGVRREA